MRSKLKSVATGLSAVQMRWQRSNDLVKKRYPVLGRLSSRLQGWRGALLIFAVTAWVLFLANAAISVVLTVRGGGVVSDGTITNPTIMSGSCASVNSADTWIHLAMNVNSAILLAATNFAMQAWTALTRSEIDQVHAEGENGGCWHPFAPEHDPHTAGTVFPVCQTRP
ncbi:hypothetical protein B0T22DRAFT_518467 [Podospora appendiculata]|uniref:DUF6536 domain-containing protein n=1 Tax=Podospora appendiculata TaxID=314037 RepID=A0AAE0X6J3_9PEZI|nr:hypothetical protein B0T22DRAFT_518467 [Podospora appendiculata]